MSEASKPIASYVDWLSDPEATAGAVAEGIDRLWESAGFWGAVAGAGLIALKFARYIPGWGTAVHSIGTMALDWLKPDGIGEAQKKAKVMEQTAWGIVEQIEKLPAEDELTKRVKLLIKENTPDEFESIFAQWKNSRKESSDASL